MVLQPIGIWKIASWCFGLLGAAALAVMDPTTKGFLLAACIVAIPPTITGIFAIYDRRQGEKKIHAGIGEVKEIAQQTEKNTNSTLTQLRVRTLELHGQVDAATTRADIAEGSEAGRQLARTEAAEDKAKEKL